METLYLRAVSFQIVHTSSSTISWAGRMAQKERKSMGEKEVVWPSLSWRDTAFGFASLFCCATPGQVPGATVNGIEQYYSLTRVKNILAARRWRVTSIYDMNIVGHGM